MGSDEGPLPLCPYSAMDFTCLGPFYFVLHLEMDMVSHQLTKQGSWEGCCLQLLSEPYMLEPRNLIHRIHIL